MLRNKEKSVRVNISMPSWMKEELQERAEDDDRSLSGYIQMILKRYLIKSEK